MASAARAAAAVGPCQEGMVAVTAAVMAAATAMSVAGAAWGQAPADGVGATV